MKKYRWRCNACESVNGPSATRCERCGCPASASFEDIKECLNPEIYKINRARRQFAILLIIFIYIPFYFAVYALNGKLISLFTLICITIFLSIKNINLLKYVWNSKWAKYSILSMSSFLLLTLVARSVLIQNNNALLNWLVVFYYLPAILSYFYIFKSKKGNELCDVFYKKS